MVLVTGLTSDVLGECMIAPTELVATVLHNARAVPESEYYLVLCPQQSPQLVLGVAMASNCVTELFNKLVLSFGNHTAIIKVMITKCNDLITLLQKYLNGTEQEAIAHSSAIFRSILTELGWPQHRSMVKAWKLHFAYFLNAEFPDEDTKLLWTTEGRIHVIAKFSEIHQMCHSLNQFGRLFGEATGVPYLIKFLIHLVRNNQFDACLDHMIENV